MRVVVEVYSSGRSRCIDGEGAECDDDRVREDMPDSTSRTFRPPLSRPALALPFLLLLDFDERSCVRRCTFLSVSHAPSMRERMKDPACSHITPMTSRVFATM